MNIQNLAGDTLLRILDWYSSSYPGRKSAGGKDRHNAEWKDQQIRWLVDAEADPSVIKVIDEGPQQLLGQVKDGSVIRQVARARPLQMSTCEGDEDESGATS